jgi:hypothetical protein
MQRILSRNHIRSPGETYGHCGIEVGELASVCRVILKIKVAGPGESHQMVRKIRANHTDEGEVAREVQELLPMM